MNLEETLAHKKLNLEKLIRNKDEAIRRELLKYEEGELYIRLQSECFNLYPVVIKALALLIVDNRKREIFCSIVKGHKLEYLAAYHNMTPEEAVNDFRSTVWELRQRIREGAFTAKESVNIRLMQERNELKYKARNYETMYKSLLLTNDHLRLTNNNLQLANDHLQLTNKNLNSRLDILLNDEKKGTGNDVIDMQKMEQTMRDRIRKELLEKMEHKSKKQPQGWMAKALNPISTMVQWVKWMKFSLFS